MWALQEHAVEYNQRGIFFCDFCGLRPQKSRSWREAPKGVLSTPTAAQRVERYAKKTITPLHLTEALWFHMGSGQVLMQY
jgi:hypothetical protein